MNVGTVEGGVQRLVMSVIGRYDYREQYVGELDRVGLALWIVAWLAVDFYSSWFFDGFSWWWLAGGPCSALLLWWWLPLPLAEAMVALQISRALLSPALGALGFLGVSVGLLSPAVLVLQLWVLALDWWLILLYLRTPKREIGG